MLLSPAGASRQIPRPLFQGSRTIPSHGTRRPYCRQRRNRLSHRILQGQGAAAMAITPDVSRENSMDVEPTEAAEVRRFHVHVPDSFTFSRPEAELVYDRPSDTMLVLFHGRDKGAFTVNVVDDYSVLLDI